MVGLFSTPATHVSEGINDWPIDGYSALHHNNVMFLISMALMLTAASF